MKWFKRKTVKTPDAPQTFPVEDAEEGSLLEEMVNRAWRDGSAFATVDDDGTAHITSPIAAQPGEEKP